MFPERRNPSGIGKSAASRKEGWPHGTTHWNYPPPVRLAGLVAALALAAAALFLPVVARAAGSVDTWNGTADTSWYTENPDANAYTISTAEELAGFAQLVDNGNSFAGVTITLASDLDLSGHEWNGIGSTSSTTPGAKFRGTFDGAYHTISGMTINDPTKSCGFFDYLETGATVQNVRLKNAFLNATGGSGCSFSQGLLVGWTYTDVNYAPENQATIANCSTSGTIQLQNPVGSMNVGGIVGLAQRQTTITGCSSTATISVTGTASRSCFIGGIAGYLSSSADLAIHLDDCYFAGTITTDVPDSIVGGIFGARWASQTNGLLTISNCHSANSSITSNNASTAVALIGSDWAQHDATWDTGQPAISNCFWQESDQMGVAKVERNGSVTFPTDQSQFGSPVTDFSDPTLVEKLSAGAVDTWAMGVDGYPVLAWQTDLALADYSGVDAALATIPADLSLYTAESAAAVTTARDAVDRTLTADQQTQVDDMAATVEAALAALEEVPSSGTQSGDPLAATGDPTVLLAPATALAGGTVLLARRKVA